MRIIQNAFQAYYPALSSYEWQHAVATCYPVLEVAGSDVELREEDMVRLATYLRSIHLDANSPILRAYCPSARHVAHKLNGIFRRVEWALTQGVALSANQPQEVLELYQSILESIGDSDAIADNISSAFTFRDSNRLPPRRVLFSALGIEATSSTEVLVPVRNKRSIYELPEQWTHLQAWFKQNNDPARPWSVSEIARQLKLNQSVVRALLVGPKGAPGYSRTAFTKIRLKRLQRFFKTYGYNFS